MITVYYVLIGHPLKTFDYYHYLSLKPLSFVFYSDGLVEMDHVKRQNLHISASGTISFEFLHGNRL